MMGICMEGDFVTMKKFRSLIGNYMRVIAHTEGTIVVDIKEEVFYVVKSTGQYNHLSNEAVYEVILVGIWGRLIKLLISGVLG